MEGTKKIWGSTIWTRTAKRWKPECEPGRVIMNRTVTKPSGPHERDTDAPDQQALHVRSRRTTAKPGRRIDKLTVASNSHAMNEPTKAGRRHRGHNETCERKLRGNARHEPRGARIADMA
ncbi:hypothetical protein R1flu_000259 [Riccia fluitans]|uniref:Uncharacterized protein n=1 Tax=Riccia fluitans TaxID=41844 RepID=A0ABD1XZY2_9MARC